MAISANKRHNVFMKTFYHCAYCGKILSDKNAAILIEEKDIDTVIPILSELIVNKEKREKLEKRIGEACIRDSNKRILEEIKKVSKC
jgi:UDP-N-acetylglucosamine:LPS N-acetylglucosamine transferase